MIALPFGHRITRGQMFNHDCALCGQHLTDQFSTAPVEDATTGWTLSAHRACAEQAEYDKHAVAELTAYLKDTR